MDVRWLKVRPTCWGATILGLTLLLRALPAQALIRLEQDNDSLKGAAVNGDIPLMEQIAAEGEPVDGNGRSPQTPLTGAVRACRLEAVRWLLDHGADPNRLDRDGEAPLHRTRRDCPISIAALLLARGANPNLRSRFGHTPVYEAAKWKTPQELKMLIDAGGEVMASSTNGNEEAGNTPLHGAARLGRTAAVRVLLDAGAEVNARNKAGLTPLHSALEFCRPETVRLLVARGADLFAADEAGRRPIDLLRRRKDPAVLQLVIRAAYLPRWP